MRIIRAADCKVMPWKNGGGTTTEIAVSPEAASLDDFDWRISMAHVGTDGPFSAFAGIDRTLAVISGAGIVLASGDGTRASLTQSSAPYSFPGEQTITGLLIDGAIDDLNMMTRRGRWRHTMDRITGAGRSALTLDAGLLMLFAQSGRWTVTAQSASAELTARDSVILAGNASVALDAAAPEDELLAIRLSPLA